MTIDEPNTAKQEHYRAQTSCAKESFETFPDPDAEADDFQSLMETSLSKVTSLVKISWRSAQLFLRKVANRQKEKGQ